MFGIPQPQPDSQPADCPSVNGCDMLNLHDDVTEVEKLLKVIYGQGPHYKRLSQASFNFYKPVLLLARKYEMNHILQTYLPYIIDGWPTELGDWDLLQQHMRLMAEASREKDSKGNRFAPVVNETFVEPASAIQLARYFSTSFAPILPTLYYQLASIPFYVDTSSPGYTKYLEGGDRTADRSLLLGAEYETMLLGKTTMDRYIAALVMKAPENLVSGCYRDVKSPNGSSTTCGRSRYWAEVMCHYFVKRIGSNNDGPLDVLDGIIHDVRTNAGLVPKRGHVLCEKCNDMLTESLKECRRELWEKLPHFFGIEDKDQGP